MCRNSQNSHPAIARQPQEPEIRDRRVAADGGEVARIDVAEGFVGCAAQPQQRFLRGVLAQLFGGLRDSGQRLAGLMGE